VKDNRTLMPADDHDVMERAGTVLDERNGGPARIDFHARQPRGGMCRESRCPARPHRGDEIIGPNPSSRPIHERRKILRRDSSFSPVAEHHGRRRAAAEQFGLRDVGNVEQREGARVRTVGLGLVLASGRTHECGRC
jgi:hypothetical protein